MTRILLEPDAMHNTADVLDATAIDLGVTPVRLAAEAAAVMPPALAGEVAGVLARVGVRIEHTAGEMAFQAKGLRTRAATIDGDADQGLLDRIFDEFDSVSFTESSLLGGLLSEFALKTLGGVGLWGSLKKSAWDVAKWTKHASWVKPSWRTALVEFSDRKKWKHGWWKEDLGFFGKGAGSKILTGVGAAITFRDNWEKSAVSNPAGRGVSSAVGTALDLVPELAVIDVATGGAVGGATDIYATMIGGAISGNWSDYDRAMDKAAHGGYGWLFKGASDFGGWIGEHDKYGFVLNPVDATQKLYEDNLHGVNGPVMQAGAEVVAGAQHVGSEITSGADKAFDKLTHLF